MKKFIISVICALCMGAAFAAGENVATSKAFVDTAVAQKQDKISANSGTAQVLTNTGTTGTVGTKDIYDSSAAYSGQTDSLIDAATMNAAVQNAIDAEFKCVQYNPNDSTDCWLVDIGAPALSALPTGYTRLEYIESTGTQYIDTGIKFTSEKIAVHITASGRETAYGVGNNMGMYGAQDAPNTNSAIVIYDNSYYIGTLGSTNKNLFTDVSNAPSTVRIYADNGKAIIIDYRGNVINSNYTGSVKSHNTWAIGRMNGEAGPVGGFKGKIKSVTLFDNDIMVFNVWAARRDSDGVLGMYDTVTNTFFTNSGTGEFIAGPVFSYLPQDN